MNTDHRIVGIALLEKGVLVPFHIVEEQVLDSPDEAEFGLRIELTIDEDDGIDIADALAIGAFGFIFLIASLSFHDARPRGASFMDFDEADEFEVGDLLEGLRYEDAALHYYGDYIRGRRVKTDILVQPDGKVRLQTIGRGKAALRWLDRIRGKKSLAAVDANERDA